MVIGDVWHGTDGGQWETLCCEGQSRRQACLNYAERSACARARSPYRNEQNLAEEKKKNK